MVLAILLLLQDKVELQEFKTSYLLTKPAGYSDRVSWPAVLDLGGPKDPAREPDSFVVAPADPDNEALAVACLIDLKTRYRIHPERVVVRGGAAALALASGRGDLFGGCVLQHARAFTPPKKSPPCVVFLDREDADRARVVAAAMVMKKGGIDVEVREALDRPGAILEAISPKMHPRGDLPKAGEFRQAGRYLDASLICIDLLDHPDTERLARTMLKSIDGAAIMELAKVEIAMADKKYKDAILRCREAARQFSWVPSGERLKKRLAELESRPEVKRALATED
jgi:hypothetical protein